jgi:hypothetical protein
MTLTPKFKRRATEANESQAQRPDPGLRDLQPVMMDALWHYPEARKALRDALHAFAATWYGGAWSNTPGPGAR